MHGTQLITSTGLHSELVFFRCGVRELSLPVVNMFCLFFLSWRLVWYPHNNDGLFLNTICILLFLILYSPICVCLRALYTLFWKYIWTKDLQAPNGIWNNAVHIYRPLWVSFNFSLACCLVCRIKSWGLLMVFIHC